MPWTAWVVSWVPVVWVAVGAPPVPWTPVAWVVTWVPVVWVAVGAPPVPWTPVAWVVTWVPGVWVVTWVPVVWVGGVLLELLVDTASSTFCLMCSSKK